MVEWADGTQSWFHFFWLRENCRCCACWHAEAWERMVGLLDIPLDIEPANFDAQDDGLVLTWPSSGGLAQGTACEGSRYSWEFLRANRTETAARLARKGEKRAWDNTSLDIAQAVFDWSHVMTSGEGLLAALESIESIGFVLLDNGPAEPGSVIDIANRVAFLEGSHFGWDFDVESKESAENLAYTPRRLDPHNDLPSRKHMPGVQLLHCLRNDAAGGESILVDAVAVATRLQAEAPAEFELLASEPVCYTSMGANWDVRHRAPVIDRDADGDIVGTRFHPALLGTVDVSPDKIGDFYRAYRLMLEIASDPAMQLVFRLKAGQTQLFDNQRVLHARCSFDPSTGGRHLQGCYVPLDDLYSRLEILRRGGDDFRLR